jgi:molybdenum cofactor guanylyltransferase
MVTAVVLAGGRGTRIGGNKPAVELGGVPLLQWAVDAVSAVADRIVFSVAPEQELPGIRCRLPAIICEDLLPGRGPLSGVYSGLQASEAEHVLVVPCDAPFVEPALLELLWENRCRKDAVIPVVGQRQQTLVAVYGRACARPMEAALNSGDLSMHALLRDVAVRYMPEDTLRTVDPELRSFSSVNTRAELDSARHAALALCS